MNTTLLKQFLREAFIAGQEHAWLTFEDFLKTEQAEDIFKEYEKAVAI